MAGKKSYKTLLIEARELQTQAGKNAYRRASIMVTVFSDRDFRHDSGALDDKAATALLDGYVEDLCLGFDELRAMLAAFPTEDAWADGKLASLYERTVELAKETAKANREQSEDSGISRKRVTIKDVDNLKQQKQEVELSLKRAEREVSEKDETISSLKGRIHDLEIENAQLKGRIEQLEKSFAVSR